MLDFSEQAGEQKSLQQGHHRFPDLVAGHMERTGAVFDPVVDQLDVALGTLSRMVSVDPKRLLHTSL